MSRRNVYQCECGKLLRVKQVVKNNVTTCPACGGVLPHKVIMQCYYRRRVQARKIRLACSCGKKSSFPFPTKGKCLCPKCGGKLMEISTKIINGVALPRYLEINLKSEVKNV